MNREITIFYRVLFIVIFAGLISTNAVLSWGPLTHMGINLEAGEKNGLPVSPELMGAYLAGATEPDIGAGDNGLDSGVSADYGVYHDPVFIEAMEKVAAGKESPEKELLAARALGFRSHIAADSIAHTGTGYPNSKEVFSRVAIDENYMPHHITNELCVDILMFKTHGKEIKNSKPLFMDAETLLEVRNEYASLKGIDLDSDKDSLASALLKHKATVMTEMNLADHLIAKQPEKVNQMEQFYSDVRLGVNGIGGLTPSVEIVSTKVIGTDELKNFKSDSGIKKKIENFLTNEIPDEIGNRGLALVESGILDLIRNDFIRKNLSGTLNDKMANAKVERLVANFAINLVGDNKMSFEESLFRAETQVYGPPAQKDDRLEELGKEAEFLKLKRDEALKKYQERPIWKLWLFITQSDKKEYLAIEEQYNQKLFEIELLEAAAVTVAAPANADAAQKAGEVSGLAKLRQDVEEAYRRYVEAVEARKDSAVGAAKENYLLLRGQLDAAIMKARESEETSGDVN